MSSIDFHEDEWGRHWSHAPIHQLSRLNRSRSILALVSGWLAVRAGDIREHWLDRQDRLTFERMSIESLRDIFPEDQVLPLRANPLDAVRDSFGRPLV